jgi:hypothetical protein
MYFDFNMKKLEVYKYILLHHSLDSWKKLIFDLFATYFICWELCLYFNEFCLNLF